MATVDLQDNGQILCNPMMGWVHHHYDNSISNYGGRLAPADTLEDFPGLSVVYLRLAWSYLEPSEGNYNWSIFDAPAQRWIARGKKIALRVSCSESEISFATPVWVKAAGAKGYFFKPGTGVVAEGESPLWEPDYQDAVFLSKLDRFLAALARRYDGEANVAYIDVGSFGVWGEGHNFWSTKRHYSSDAIIPHIDLYLKHFKKTLLVANWTWMDHGRGPAAFEYALAKNMTMRTDSILVLPPPQLYHPEHAAAVWPRLPVVLETEHYGLSCDRGAWGDGSGFLQAVEEYHASYVSIHWWPREFLHACRPLIEKISLRMGYRLQLTKAAWPDTVPAGAELPFESIWRNAGVAPCYPGGHLALTLKDAGGGIVAVLVDPALDVRSLLPSGDASACGDSVMSRLALPANVPPGTYDLFVSIGSLIGTPQIALPLDGTDGQMRYRQGQIQVTCPG